MTTADHDPPRLARVLAFPPREGTAAVAEAGIVAADVTPAVDAVPCRCGHPREMHEHYRQGDDCGSCRCRSFRVAAPSRAQAHRDTIEPSTQISGRR